MSMHNSLPYLLWTAFGVLWEVRMFAIKNFVETLKQEVPQAWESIGSPRFGIFGGNIGKTMPYLTKREYVTLNNAKVSRAALWTNVSIWPLAISLTAIISYYALPFIRSIAQ